MRTAIVCGRSARSGAVEGLLARRHTYTFLLHWLAFKFGIDQVCGLKTISCLMLVEHHVAHVRGLYVSYSTSVVDLCSPDALLQHNLYDKRHVQNNVSASMLSRTYKWHEV